MEEDFGLPKQVKPFYSFGPIEDPIRHQEQVVALEGFIRSHKLGIAKLKRKLERREYPNPDQYVRSSFMLMSVMRHFQKEIDEVVYDYEISSLEAVIDVAAKMLALVSCNPKAIVDIPAFCQFLLDAASKRSEYKTLKYKRRSLQQKSKHIMAKRMHPDYLNQIRIEYLAANQRYDSELQYSPPSVLDFLIAEYLYTSPLKDLIKPTSDIIAEGAIDPAVFTISEFSLRVYKHLNITGTNSKSIVYTSVIRMLFDEAYATKTELRRFNQANSLFLFRAEEFSCQTVRDLKLSDSIVKNFTVGLPVASLFKTKQLDMLKQMETMTNPIDLMKHVHTILIALAQSFGTEGMALSFDDTLTLLLALISISPPANAVSICKFVEKWDDIQLSTVVGIAKNYLIAAVETLLKPEEMKDDTK